MNLPIAVWYAKQPPKFFGYNCCFLTIFEIVLQSDFSYFKDILHNMKSKILAIQVLLVLN